MRELDDARYKAIGARIRDVRLQRNMSQAELAEKAFISVPHMSEVENGKTKSRLSTFVYITEALQVSADVLLRTNTPEVNGISVSYTHLGFYIVQKAVMISFNENDLTV